jgi:pilus assembly protein TadC
MKGTPDGFVKKAMILSIIFAVNVAIIFFVLLRKTEIASFAIIAFFFSLFFLLLIFMQLPKINISKVRQDIEADIFVPSRMLITLLESGNSIVTALERVSYTNAKSSKYFGKIASEINLGKSLPDAIDEAILYTPSESFKRFLQPIRKSLKAGTDIQANLNAVLDDLVKEKVIEIERYEKRLGALSLFYMIFGVIIPAVGVVAIVIIMSVMGLTVNFFPFLFILLLLIGLMQFGFIKIFQNIRPLMRTS